MFPCTGNINRHTFVSANSEGNRRDRLITLSSFTVNVNKALGNWKCIRFWRLSISQLGSASVCKIIRSSNLGSADHVLWPCDRKDGLCAWANAIDEKPNDIFHCALSLHLLLLLLLLLLSKLLILMLLPLLMLLVINKAFCTTVCFQNRLPLHHLADCGSKQKRNFSCISRETKE